MGVLVGWSFSHLQESTASDHDLRHEHECVRVAGPGLREEGGGEKMRRRSARRFVSGRRGEREREGVKGRCTRRFILRIREYGVSHLLAD